MPPTTESRRRLFGDLAGACGDLGTFLPLVMGALALTGLPATGILVGFGLAYGLAATVYRAPMAVQPMKVAAAVLIASAPAVARSSPLVCCSVCFSSSPAPPA